MNSRAKGKRGELEARDACRKWWYSSKCIRAAQSCGKYGADLLDALKWVHVEVKLYKRISALDFLKQAESDKKSDEIPIVLMRENDRASWTVMFRIEDTERFVQAYLANQRKAHEDSLSSDPT